jgi:mRNA interferase MazF
MKLKAGDVALLPMPQADGKLKSRPILLLKKMPPYGDWLICGISTQLQQESNGFDIIILDKESHFKATGLKASSVIRLGFITVVSESKIPGTIGVVPSSIVKELLKRLAAHLLK